MSKRSQDDETRFQRKVRTALHSLEMIFGEAEQKIEQLLQKSNIHKSNDIENQKASKSPFVKKRDEFPRLFLGLDNILQNEKSLLEQLYHEDVASLRHEFLRDQLVDAAQRQRAERGAAGRLADAVNAAAAAAQANRDRQSETKS